MTEDHQVKQTHLASDSMDKHEESASVFVRERERERERECVCLKIKRQ